MQTTFVNGLNPWKPYFGEKPKKVVNTPCVILMKERVKIVECYCAELDEFTVSQICKALKMNHTRVAQYFKYLGYVQTTHKIGPSLAWRKA